MKTLTEEDYRTLIADLHAAEEDYSDAVLLLRDLREWAADEAEQNSSSSAWVWRNKIDALIGPPPKAQP